MKHLRRDQAWFCETIFLPVAEISNARNEVPNFSFRLNFTSRRLSTEASSRETKPLRLGKHEFEDRIKSNKDRFSGIFVLWRFRSKNICNFNSFFWVKNFIFDWGLKGRMKPAVVLKVGCQDYNEVYIKGIFYLSRLPKCTNQPRKFHLCWSPLCK